MFANAEMARAKTERGAASKLPPAPPPLTRRPFACDFASGLASVRGNNSGLARYIFEKLYAKPDGAHLIYAGRTFYEWRDGAWKALDPTDLAAIAFQFLHAANSKKDMDKVLYALKLLTRWPRPPVLSASGV